MNKVINDNKKEIEMLYEFITKLENVDECRALFEDLCTYKEIAAMAQRLHAAKLLMDGTTYEQIIVKTGISSATLSRVSKCVKYGIGYQTTLNKKS